MVKIVPIPDWFLGKDIIIELFSFLVLIIFSLLALKYFRMDKKNRKFLYLGAGFGMIALAQLSNIITKLVLYYDIGPSQDIGKAIITSQILSSIDIFYYAGFFFSRLLILLGLYIIYRLPRNKKSSFDWVIGLYFVVISALQTQNVYYLFHITAFVILVLIMKNYYDLYKKNKNINTKILISAFGILALSQLVYIFSKIGDFFVAANIIELISYTALLILIIRILYNGKKKKSYGYNIRYDKDNSGKKRKH